MAPKFKKKLTIHLVPQFMTRLIGAYCRVLFFGFASYCVYKPILDKSPPFFYNFVSEHLMMACLGAETCSVK
jgi:hypothetical protein